MTDFSSPISDEQLREEILSAFALDNRIDSAQLRVGVLNGIAHLAGTVASLSTRSAAEGLAVSIQGVRGVVNRIDAPGAPSPNRVINLPVKE